MTLTAPSSEVAVCNLALTQLKQATVAQIDPPPTDGVVENLCALWYHQIRQETLEMHPWNFGTKRNTLTADTGNPPVFGFTHAFTLPNDFIRYNGRFDSLGNFIAAADDDYEIENGQILVNNVENTDSPTLYYTYVYDHTTITKWSPLFVRLFSLNLAVTIGPNFSSSEARVKELKEQFKDVKQEAKSIDGQQRPPKRRERSKFIRARRTNPTVASSFTKFD